MPKVTRVEPQKTNPHRFNIYLDDRFAFSADEDIVVEYRLLPQKFLTEVELEKILLDSEAGKWIRKVYRLLGRRARSEKEIRNYLKEKNLQAKRKGQEGISEIVQEIVIQKLKERGLINDGAFAQAWIENRKKERGPLKLRYELEQKGIGTDLIEELLADVSFTEEIANAKALLLNKMKKWHNLSNRELKKKAIEFLLRRGFDYQVAKDVVEKIRENS